MTQDQRELGNDLTTDACMPVPTQKRRRETLKPQLSARDRERAKERKRKRGRERGGGAQKTETCNMQHAKQIVAHPAVASGSW